MIHFENRGPQISEVDIAYEILQVQGSPKNYYDLIVDVLTRLDLPINAGQISSVLTQINLDTRFVYLGRGEWGLKAWASLRSVKKQPAITLLNKKVTSDDEFDQELSDEANDDMNDPESDSDLEDGILEMEDSLEQEVQRLEDKWGGI